MDERQDSRISEKNGKDRTAASGERIRMEEAIRPDRDDEMMRRREAARQKRREERMRAIRMQRMVFLGVAAVLLIVVIIVAVSCARRNRDSEMNQSSAGSGQTSDAWTQMADQVHESQRREDHG